MTKQAFVTACQTRGIEDEIKELREISAGFGLETSESRAAQLAGPNDLLNFLATPEAWYGIAVGIIGNAAYDTLLKPVFKEVRRNASIHAQNIKELIRYNAIPIRHSDEVLRLHKLARRMACKEFDFSIGVPSSRRGDRGVGISLQPDEPADTYFCVLMMAFHARGLERLRDELATDRSPPLTIRLRAATATLPHTEGLGLQLSGKLSDDGSLSLSGVIGSERPRTELVLTLPGPTVCPSDVTALRDQSEV